MMGARYAQVEGYMDSVFSTSSEHLGSLACKSLFDVMNS